MASAGLRQQIRRCGRPRTDLCGTESKKGARVSPERLQPGSSTGAVHGGPLTGRPRLCAAAPARSSAGRLTGALAPGLARGQVAALGAAMPVIAALQHRRPGSIRPITPFPAPLTSGLPNDGNWRAYCPTLTVPLTLVSPS